MRLGVTIFATDRTMPPHELAVAAEERGFASLYLPEHTHIPVSRLTPSPTGQHADGTSATGRRTSYLEGTSGDNSLAEDYAHTLDPLTSLAAAAARTSRITLGTGVLLAAQREPIVTAKALATLDHLAPGRVVLGVGYGWNREEAADHGVAWSARRDIVREHLLAMRALWTQEQASYKGSYVALEPSWAWPKPACLPILMGGAPGPKLFAAIAELADGWIPIGGAGIREALPSLRRAFEAADRDPATLTVVPFGTLPTPAKLDYFAGLGIQEVVLRLPSAPAPQVLRALDGYMTYLD